MMLNNEATMKLVEELQQSVTIIGNPKTTYKSRKTVKNHYQLIEEHDYIHSRRKKGTK